ncbi:MAG: phosphoglycerate kinase [Gammaproteobacteria bacterium]|nr:phosphoglycerate kinase [Gammaproteobacteria bacterium]
MSVLNMTDLDLADQRVLIREDFNVPVKDGLVTSAKRIKAALPTIHLALERGAKVILLSHRGRPVEGRHDQDLSLLPVAEYLESHCHLDVRLEKNWLDGIDVKAGEVVMCENVRFQAGEQGNDEHLSKKMAALCDIYVMDAFGTAHRSQASTCGVARHAPVACAGPLLVKELDMLDRSLTEPARPMVGIVGGSKVSTKLTILKSLLDKVDQLVVGGGIANTFLAAAGKPVGKSLYEKDLLGIAGDLLRESSLRNTDIPLPTDVVCATGVSDTAIATIKGVDDVEEEDMILDIGPDTSKRLADYLSDAGTIIWNGPLGMFELDAFSRGTEAVARAVADSPAFSIAGGGDTLAAVDRFDLEDQISYISTGGGAFLEYLEGKTLPAVDMLEHRSRS